MGHASGSVSAEALLRGQQQVLEMVASSAPVGHSLSAIARFAEQFLPDMKASILYFDKKAGTLRKGGYGALPDSFAQIVDGMVPGPNMGSCGTCAYRGSRVISTDVFDDPLWAGFHDLCRTYEIRSAWSSPLISSKDGSVLGVFGMYYPYVHVPDAGDLAFVDTFTHLAAIAAQRHRDDEEQRHLSLHDALTGLANRHALDLEGEALFARSVAEKQPLSLVFIDLDKFGLFNFSFGHVAADHLLKEVCGAIADELAPCALLTRFGGDEFVALFEAPVGEVRERLDRLRALLASGMPLSNLHLGVTYSCGLAERSDTHANLASLILEANDAARVAKDAGGDRCVVVDEANSSRRVREVQVRQALTDMLGLNPQILDPHLQPLIDLESGRCTGFEALLRMRDPRCLSVPVSECVRVAEETGQIHALGLAMLRFALETVSHERDRLAGRTIHVNVSVRQLVRREFLSEVEDLLAEFPGGVGQICLEVTESHWLDTEGPARDVLCRLRDLGFSLALDDFGTGYASLRYLQSLPFTSLKIDRSFTQSVDDGGQGTELCRALLAMANACGLSAVVEGVETADQERSLRELGYRVGQGYRWARPMPAAVALAMLDDGERVFAA